MLHECYDIIIQVFQEVFQFISTSDATINVYHNDHDRNIYNNYFMVIVTERKLYVTQYGKTGFIAHNRFDFFFVTNTKLLEHNRFHCHKIDELKLNHITDDLL